MTLDVLLEGLTFPEGPRWHDGRLWFSDFYDHHVVAVDPDGNRSVVVEVPQQPSGLGWLPDGRLLVVSMLDRRLMVFDGERFDVFADLSPHATFHCNDMVVGGDGRAYVGNFGFDLEAGAERRPAAMVRVDPDGTVAVAADGLDFPNGTVITPDGATLIVAETFGHRLTAYDRSPDGGLTNRRVWADVSPHYPDGICLDADGAIWVSDPLGREVVRVKEGGEILDRISTGDRGAFACMLGGTDRRTLYIATAPASGEGAASARQGRIEFCRVDVAGAGWP